MDETRKQHLLDKFSCSDIEELVETLYLLYQQSENRNSDLTNDLTLQKRYAMSARAILEY